MFLLNDDNSIYVTRGDIAFFSVSAEDNGVVHHFQAGDVLRIKVFGKKNCENVVLQKDFPVTENAEEVGIFLTEEDTKIGGVISKPVDYWFEVELNPETNPQTIIGYDDEGPRLFKLFPEGNDVENYQPSPEDFPVVDEELDPTSPRPVSNMAVSSAIALLESAVENGLVAMTANTPQLFGAVADGVADDTAAIQECLNTYNDVVLPAGTYVISSPLIINRANQTMRGLSQDVIIKAKTGLSGEMLLVDGSRSPAYRSNQHVKNIHFKGNGTCDGLHFYKNADFFIDGVKVSDCGWGIVSDDSLLYNIFASTVIDCKNGVKFKNSNELSAANNVCFEMCKIIQIAEYAIYSESGDSTHNVVFQCCEIEATNTAKANISPVTLQSKSTSGASPIMVFRNCWFELNHGSIPVLITGADGNQKQYIFDGCAIINAANACECFIKATGRTLVMLNQSDPCTYTGASVKVISGKLFILGGVFSYEIDDENNVTHLAYDGFVNSPLVMRNGYGVLFKSAGGSDNNKIYGQSNKLKIVADKEVVLLDGAKGVDMVNSYLKPMILGSVYLWTYNKTVYVKHGSRPTQYNDGTVLITLS